MITRRPSNEVSQLTGENPAPAAARRSSGNVESSWRHWGWILILSVVLLQCAEQYWFCGYGYDKVEQVVAAKSWLAGNSLSVPRLDTRDLGAERRGPLVGWPPGYSMAVAGGMSLGLSSWQAALVLDWLSTLTFYTAWLFLLQRQPWPVAAGVWLYWLLGAQQLSGLTSSDALAVALFSAALASAVAACQYPARRGILALVSGLAAGAAASVRFAYWPLCLVPAGALYFALVGTKSAARTACLALLPAGLGVAGLTVYQQQSAGSATFLDSYYTPESLGLYWAQLREAYPFAAGALGFDAAWDRAVAWLQLPGDLSIAGAWIFTSAILTAFVFDGLRGMQSVATSSSEADNDSMESRASRCYGAFVLASALVTLSLLAWCTVRYPDRAGWVYAETLRYYACLFAPLLVGTAAAAEWLCRRGDALRRAGQLLVVLVVLAMVLSGIQKSRRWWRLANGTWPHDPNSVRFDDTSRQLVDLLPTIAAGGERLVYLDHHFERFGMVRLAGWPAEEWPGNLDTPFETHSPVNLVSLRRPADPPLPNWLPPNPRHARSLPEGDVWVWYLTPAGKRQSKSP